MTLTLPPINLNRTNDIHSLLNGRTQRLPSCAYPLKLLGVPDSIGQYGMDVSLGFEDTPPDESSFSVWINFADGNARDGVGDVLEIGGIDTSRHRKNPIVLFDHGKEIKLPVALAENPETKEYTVVLDPISKVGRAKAFFYRGNGTLAGVSKANEYDHALFCEQLFDLICKKFIRAGSIGYQIKSAEHLPPYERDGQGNPVGLHLISTLMLECSAVVLPANQDTTRKALSLPKVCGKPMSPVLFKSLSAAIPANTTTQIAIPHGNLSETKIPPPPMRAGWVDLKTFMDKLKVTTETFSDIEGMQDWVNRIFANPVDRHVYWVGEVGSKQLNEVKFRLKKIGVQKFSKSLRTPPKGKGWQEWNVKGSYFETCPRDNTGHCLPQQAPVGEEHGDRKPNKPPDIKKRKRNDTSADVPYRANGDSRGPSPREEVWAKGNWGMVVREGEVIRCGDPSVKIGSHVTEDWLKQNGWQRVEPTAAPTGGAGTGEKSMATATAKAGKKNIMPDRKQIPPQAPPEEEVIEEPMTADPSMDAPIDPALDATQLEAQDGMEGSDPSAEPYGAGLLRQLYGDHRILMEDYHKLMASLDNPQIYRFMEKTMMGLENAMSKMEALFSTTYGERGLKEIGDMGMEEPLPTNDGAAQMDANLAEDAEIGAEIQAGEGADVSTSPMPPGGEVDPMGDDTATPADSDPLERPEADEVASNMKRPDMKSFAAIRAYYKSLGGACKACGQANCKCGGGCGEKRYGNAPKRDAGHSSSGTMNAQPPDNRGSDTPRNVSPETETEFGKLPPETPPLGGNRLQTGGPKKGPKSTTGRKPIGPGYYADDTKSADTFEDTGEPGHKALEARELKWIGDTISFLKSIGDEEKSFDDNARMDCKGWHKLMGEVGNDMSAHWQKKPKKKEFAGDLEWLQEESAEASHKMQADEEQEMTDLNGEKRYDPNPPRQGSPISSGTHSTRTTTKVPKRADHPDVEAARAEATNAKLPKPQPPDDDGPIDLADYKSVIHSLCKDASMFLDAMSREKAFGMSHRDYAKHLAKAMEDAISTKAVPDQSEEPTPVDEQVQLAELSGTDVSVDDTGTKSLAERQSYEIECLTKQLESLVSCFP